MAQKLHDKYGYSYTNLQVLLGGWNSWIQLNQTDPKGYPIVVDATPAPGAKSNGGVVTSTVVLVPQAPGVVDTPKP